MSFAVRIANIEIHVGWWETFSMVCLVLITIFRRKLSSNHTYRRDDNRRKLFQLTTAAFITQITRLSRFFVTNADSSLAVKDKATEEKNAATSRSLTLESMSSDILTSIVCFLKPDEACRLLTKTCPSLRRMSDDCEDMIWEQVVAHSVDAVAVL